MKLTLKLVGMLIIVILLIIALDGYLSMIREVSLFHDNMRKTALLAGKLSDEMITEVWKTSGRERALELIDEINEADSKISLRFIEPGTLQKIEYLHFNDSALIRRLRGGQRISVQSRPSDDQKYLFTLVPINLRDNTFVGALELRESYSELYAYTRETIIRVFILSAVLVLVGALMIGYLGQKYVGKPLQHLIRMTERIGLGDFSQEVPLPGHNELSLLSASLNGMCGSLEAAREKLNIETDKRISAIEQLRHTERLATVGRLASGVAHELGTPLNVISGRAKILAEEFKEKPDITESCRIIAEQSDRMTKIIRQLLDFARRRRSQGMPSDIKPLLSQIVEMLTPMASKARVNIVQNIPTDLPKGLIDQSQIQQVLINIIVNGIQAMVEGGELKIQASQLKKIKPLSEPATERDVIAIGIADQGEGIHADFIEKIFDPFFTTKDIGQGTGLGLSIAHGIIEEHDGWIEVQSELGKGTVFTIYLMAEESK